MVQAGFHVCVSNTRTFWPPVAASQWPSELKVRPENSMGSLRNSASGAPVTASHTCTMDPAASIAATSQPSSESATMK